MTGISGDESINRKRDFLAKFYNSFENLFLVFMNLLISAKIRGEKFLKI